VCGNACYYFWKDVGIDHSWRGCVLILHSSLHFIFATGTCQLGKCTNGMGAIDMMIRALLVIDYMKSHGPMAMNPTLFLIVRASDDSDTFCRQLFNAHQSSMDIHNSHRQLPNGPLASLAFCISSSLFSSYMIHPLRLLTLSHLSCPSSLFSPLFVT
jgi:hypothetical protein